MGTLGSVKVLPAEQAHRVFLSDQAYVKIPSSARYLSTNDSGTLISIQIRH